MIKDAVIQSIISNGSDVKQVNTIHLRNMNWEFAIPTLMIVLGHVINKSSHNEPFTAKMINESIDHTKEFVDIKNRLYNDPFTIDVQAPDPLDEMIDIIDKIDRNEETKAYVSINWYIENGKINLSKTMVTGIENLFERKYINNANDYKTVMNEIVNELPINKHKNHIEILKVITTDVAINNIDMQSLRTIYDKYLTTPEVNKPTWLYSPKSKVMINITVNDI